MLPSATVIETPRSRLRRVTAEDIPFAFSATHHPGFCDGMPWDAPETEEVLQAVQAKNDAEWEAGTGCAFTIETRDGTSRLGRISLRRVEADTWNLGFWTHPDHQGCGYMTEAVIALTRFAFDRLGANRIRALHADWNHASRRVLEKAGFQFIEHIPQGFQKHGRWISEDLLVLLHPISKV